MAKQQLIFVSCGQLTEDEKTLGILIKAIIDATAGFEAYFAQAVQDFEASDSMCWTLFDAARERSLFYTIAV